MEIVTSDLSSQLHCFGVVLYCVNLAYLAVKGPKTCDKLQIPTFFHNFSLYLFPRGRRNSTRGRGGRDLSFCLFMFHSVT